MKKSLLIVLVVMSSPLLAYNGEHVMRLKTTKNCVNCDLSNLPFNLATQLSFRGADLSGTNFTNAELMRRDFTDANLSNAIFTNAYVTDANFRNAIFNNTDFDGAVMGHADLRDTDRERASFEDANYDDFSSDI